FLRAAGEASQNGAPQRGAVAFLRSGVRTTKLLKGVVLCLLRFSSFLLWSKQEPVFQPIVRPSAYDLARIVDAERLLQQPSRASGDQLVQVFHSPATVDKRVVVARKVSLADDHARVVDSKSPSGEIRTGKRSQVGDLIAAL